MKKTIYNLLLVITLSLTGLSFRSNYLTAQDLDTFTVTPHYRTHLITREEYSKKVLFPIKDKYISNITLDLHLNCPEKKCSDWDYSINIVLRTNKDGKKQDYQLGRMITPYSGWYNQGENTKTWDYIWSWNITEYLPLMQDSVEIVLQYEGYQDGFLATTNFIFTQDKELSYKDMPFIGVENVYYGYYPYGRMDSTIDMFLNPKKIILPKHTNKVLARMTVSGHGGDSLNAAAEFLKKHFIYTANGQVVTNQSVWKDDCGCNTIQPQGGTWIYNRSGWCPGTKVNEYYYDLTPFVKKGELNLRMLFEYYNGHNSGEAGYQIANDIFFISDENYKHEQIKDKNKRINKKHYLPKDFVLSMKTNNDARNKYSLSKIRFITYPNGITDTLKLQKLYERSQVENNTIYYQPVHLENDKDYLITIEDYDCDGLSWWASPMQGDGYFIFYGEDSSYIYDVIDPDFGCKNEYYLKTTADTNNYSLQTQVFILQDLKSKTIQVIALPKTKPVSDTNLVVTVTNRKTKEIMLNKTYNNKKQYKEIISFKDYAPGYYLVEAVCGEVKQRKILIVKD